MSYDHYLNVFLEAAWAASVIPLASEASLLSMKLFGGYNMPLAVALAVSGATLGMVFNWGIGKGLRKLGGKYDFNVSDYWYNRIAHIFNKYLVWVLLFSWAPICKLLLVPAGFLGTRLRFVLPLVILGQAFHYGRIFF